MNQNWKSRRAELLLAACEELAALSVKTDIIRAARCIARKYKGRRLGDGRRLQISRATLLRYYYPWSREKSLDVFALKYRSTKRAARSTPVTVFLLFHFAMSERMTLHQAFIVLKAKGFAVPFSYQTLMRHVAGSELRDLHETSKHAAGALARCTGRLQALTRNPEPHGAK